MRKINSKLPYYLFSVLVLVFWFGAFSSVVTAQQAHSSENEVFIIYAGNGGTTCREATTDERRQIEQIRPQGLRQINHLPDFTRQKNLAQSASHLTIILRATAALEANAAAKAAFIRGAAVWENVITSPVTLFIDADLDTTNGGATWGPNVIGSTTSATLSSVDYSFVRNLLLAGANTAQKSQVYSLLPSDSVPSDVGNSTVMSVSASIARAIGLLPATAQSSDQAARIAFNSNTNFDFDRSNGIQGSDFEAVVIHEIGHALGFTSRAGQTNLPAMPSMWDLYRFRAGTTTGTFTTAQRVMTIGGPVGNTLQFFFVPGGSDIGLSTGGPSGVTTNGGDDQQSSHWKRQDLNGGVYIGIMDPVIPNGVERNITVNDTNAAEIFGYNSSTLAPPLNDNFNLGQVIGGCSGTVNGLNAGATSESGEPNHSPDDGGGDRSVWYIWQSPVTGSVTFTTAGSDFDTVLGVYTGATLSPSMTNLGKHDDVSGTDKTSAVTFSATAGTVYRIAVDGYNNSDSGGDIGPIVLNWSSNNCPAGNPIDDAGFFVRQHYLDFLNREPDTDGFNFWRDQITSCGANAQCIDVKRINVSAAFFLSIEFQETGYYVERVYKAAYGSLTGNSTLGGAHTLQVPIVRFNEYLFDRQQIGEGVVVGAPGADALLDSRKSIYVSDFVQRSRFTTAFPTSMTPEVFVDTLNSNAGNPLSTAERNQLVTELTNATKTRAQVLRAVAEDSDLFDAEKNRAFVLAQFYGYLRRNPNDTPDSDYTGYDFWLSKLNQFNGNFVDAEMVKSFLLSGEYRHRFGP